MARHGFLTGLPVLTVAEGKRVGMVHDLVVDPELKTVSWLRLHSGGMGMLGGERLWVSAGAVHGIGEDAVTINTEGDARTPADAPEALALVKAKRGIIGAKVLTENGGRLGEVRDYEFQPDTFALTSLSVGPAMNLVGEILTIEGDKVLTIGEDVIVVASAEVMRPVVTADIESQAIP